MSVKLKLLALDTEDDSEGQPHIFNVFDGITHTSFLRKNDETMNDFRVRAWNWLYEQEPAQVWCCNTEYDLINFFGSEWLGLMVTLQYVSSGLLRGSLRDRRITFYDTLRHWPMTVEQMGEYIKLPKLDYSWEQRESWETMSSEAKDRLLRYCRRDTEIVYYFVAEMLSRYRALDLDTKATLPSMALQLFTKKFYRRKYTKIPDHLVEWLRGGYYGGRVEVYRFGEITGPIRHYDVNSLFPSVMVDGTFPNPATYQGVQHPDWTREGMAHVTITVPESDYPPLPLRGATDIIYPFGTFTGTWCYPEIREAMLYGASVLTVHEAVEFVPMPTPFKDYIHFCYGNRLQAVKHSLDDVMWKLYMNSLYGKFGQRGRLEMIYNDEDVVIESKLSASANVIWAAYVTCLARIRLLTYLHGTTECYYTDTDSLFTPDVLPTSSKLGELKLEDVYDAVNMVGNKIYAVTGTDPKTGAVTTKYKAKGVRRESAGDFIRLGRATFRKPARFRESRKTSAIANRWYEVTKKRTALYTKRRIHDDGRTSPWEFAAYRELFGV